MLPPPTLGSDRPLRPVAPDEESTPAIHRCAADLTSLWVCGDKGQLLGCNVNVESNQKPFRRISAPASDKPVFASSSSSMVHMRISHSGSQNFPVAATFLLVLRSPPLFVSCLAFIFAFLCCFLLLGMEVEKESAHRSRILPFVHIHGPCPPFAIATEKVGPRFRDCISAGPTCLWSSFQLCEYGGQPGLERVPEVESS